MLRNFIKLFIFIALTTHIIGCASAVNTTREKTNNSFRNIEFLKAGISKESIIKNLGEPFNCYNDGSLLTYLMYEDEDNKGHLKSISDIIIKNETINTTPLKYIEDKYYWYSINLIFNKNILEENSVVIVRRPRWAYYSNESFLLSQSMIQIWDIKTKDGNRSRCKEDQ